MVKIKEMYMKSCGKDIHLKFDKPIKPFFIGELQKCWWCHKLVQMHEIQPYLPKETGKYKVCPKCLNANVILFTY